nr:restriction endonuclease subunit S [Brooklawnia sp. SH051]
MLKAAEYVSEGVPLISTGEIGHGEFRISSSTPRVGEATLERLPQFRLREGDVVFARKGGVERNCYVSSTEDGWFLGSDALRIRVGEDVCGRFLAYHVASPFIRRWLVQQAGGSTMASLNQEILERIPVSLPPSDEQRRIADVLGAFDDLIRTDRRLAEQLDALRRTWVSGALAASSVTTSLNEVASFVNGRNFTNGADGTGRPVIRTPEVRSGPGGNTVWSSVAVADDGRIARVGDILFVWSGSLMVNRWIYTDGLVNQHVFKVIPNQVPDWYVFALIEAQLPWFVSLAKDKATTMGHIQRANLDVPMTGLNPDTIARLGPAIEPIWSAALELRLEAQELARQRDELLPLLMSGRVRVSEVEGVA